MATDKQTRIDFLTQCIADLKASHFDKVTPKKRELFLLGYCLANYRNDIIFQIGYNFGRADTLLKDLEELVETLKNKE